MRALQSELAGALYAPFRYRHILDSCVAHCLPTSFVELTSGRARGLFTRPHPTLLRALEHYRPRFLVSRWRCQSASCFCSRPLPIDVNKRTRTHHARPCHTSGRAREPITHALAARLARSCRSSRGLFTHAHAARLDSHEHRRQDAHEDSSLAHIPHFIGHWSTIDQGFASPVCRDGSARLHFVLFSHLAHITGIPFHDISHT